MANLTPQDRLKIVIVILLCALVISATSCRTYKKEVESWKKSAEEMIILFDRAVTLIEKEVSK